MSCSRITGCELFLQFALNPALEIWQQHYCNADWRQCARFYESNAGQPVPMTLLPNGKRINVIRTEEELGATVLFNSIAKKRAGMVRSLIRAGINVNARNIEGTTALMSAIESGFAPVAGLLLEHGADPSIVNMHGKSAWDLLNASGDESMRALAQKYGKGRVH